MENIEIGNLSKEDYKELIVAMEAAYPVWKGNYWSVNSIDKLINIFPEGQIVIKADNVVVGCALSIIVNYNTFGDNHKYKQIGYLR